MTAEFAIGGIYLAQAPLTALLALALALVVHRLLVAARLYRWIWHPVLFDTALFVVIWWQITRTPLPIMPFLPVLQGFLP